MKLDSKKVLFLICLGSILEYYDFGIFIYLAPFIGKSLIPASNAWLNLLLSYAIFAAGALFRPLGGVVFAHLGDTRGRKHTFVYTILICVFPSLNYHVSPFLLRASQLQVFQPLQSLQQNLLSLLQHQLVFM